MQLSEVAKKHKGLGYMLARHLHVTAGITYQWISDKKKVPIARCGQISRFCSEQLNCDVSKEELRPDIDWDSVTYAATSCNSNPLRENSYAAA